MNHELKAPQDIEPILSSCKTGVGKPRIFTGALLALTGAALCMGVTSCVSPYDTHGGGYVTTQTYSPGYRVNSLPRGYREINHRGTTYYQSGDRYYSRQGSGYVVVSRPY